MNLKERLLQMAVSVLPMRKLSHRPFTPRDACRRAARGNVRMMLGRVMFKDDVEKLRLRVESYEF